jgi:hypothetical protein
VLASASQREAVYGVSGLLAVIRNYEGSDPSLAGAEVYL